MLNVMYAIFGIGFVFVMTACGAACVFFTSQHGNKNLIGGIAAGIMLAASVWSLLLPAEKSALSLNQPAWLVVTLGFFIGAAMLFITDLFYPSADNSCKSRCKKIWCAMTIHNFPEGMAVGVAFGCVALATKNGVNISDYSGAVGIAIGIGLQNFPEGFATSSPWLACGNSKKYSFFMGALSGLSEILGGIVGFLLCEISLAVTPFALSFAAGAMIYACVTELIPECCLNVIGKITFLVGFFVMTVLDLFLG